MGGDANGRRLWLPSIFGDHLVVQRGKPVRIWGLAPPGSPVTVRAAGAAGTALAGPTGRWDVTLAPLESVQPFSLVVATPTEEIVRGDVVVGEVWLAGGQSNMTWHLRQNPGGREAAAAADLPRLRVFVQEPHGADGLVGDASGGRWTVCTPEAAGEFFSLPFFFARQLIADLETAIGIVQAAVPGTVIESWIPAEVFGDDPRLGEGVRAYRSSIPLDYEDQYRRWEADVIRFKAGGSGAPASPWILWGPPGPRHPKRPFAFYHGMVAPLAPFTLRGVLWYQGEGNVWNWPVYEELLTALIAWWRGIWLDPTLPFLIVQLPGAALYHGFAALWPQLREAQRRVTERVPGTHLVGTIDLGDPNDMHPPDKRPCAARVAAVAEYHVYGRRGVDPDGPKPAEIVAANGAVKITFAGAPKGLELVGESPFELAGEDGVFRPAGLRIIGPHAIEVRCPELIAPRAVRYNWAADPKGWLREAGGRPAGPFLLSSLSSIPAK